MAGRLPSRRGGQRRVRAGVASNRSGFDSQPFQSYRTRLQVVIASKSILASHPRHSVSRSCCTVSESMLHCQSESEARRAAATEPCQRFAASSQPSGVAPAFKSGRAPTESGFLTSESTLAASALCKDSDMLRLLSTGSDITLNAES